MTFNEIIQDNLDIVFDVFSPITATYKPYGKVEREIEALVFYINENPNDGTGKPKYPVVNIIVRNNTLTGISSAEVDIGAEDKVELPVRQGDSDKKDFNIAKILTQNSAFLKLECR